MGGRGGEREKGGGRGRQGKRRTRRRERGREWKKTADIVHITEFRCSTGKCSRKDGIIVILSGTYLCILSYVGYSIRVSISNLALESYDIAMVKHCNLMICKQQIATDLTVKYTEACPTDWHW